MQNDLSATATHIQVSELTAFRPESSELEATELIIRPRRGWIAVDWEELFRYRELLFFLIWRDIKVRYKQAVLGAGWAILQPIINALVFTVIFGLGLNLRGDLKVAYPVYVFSGLIVWQLFATSINMGGMSLVNQQHLLTKIYFPRLFVPTAVIGGALFDMMIATPVLAALLFMNHITPSWTIVFLPLLITQLVLLSLGLGYLLSALTVTYRDFRFLIPFMVQIWMWVSFVAIPVQPGMATGTRWKMLFALNPMFGIVSSFRRMVLDLHEPQHGWSPLYMGISILTTLMVFLLGLFYFRRTERRFADIA